MWLFFKIDSKKVISNFKCQVSSIKFQMEREGGRGGREGGRKEGRRRRAQQCLKFQVSAREKRSTEVIHRQNTKNTIKITTENTTNQNHTSLDNNENTQSSPPNT